MGLKNLVKQNLANLETTSIRLIFQRRCHLKIEALQKFAEKSNGLISLSKQGSFPPDRKTYEVYNLKIQIPEEHRTFASELVKMLDEKYGNYIFDTADYNNLLCKTMVNYYDRIGTFDEEFSKHSSDEWTKYFNEIIEKKNKRAESKRESRKRLAEVSFYLNEDELAHLDELKTKLKANSRSDIFRKLISEYENRDSNLTLETSAKIFNFMNAYVQASEYLNSLAVSLNQDTAISSDAIEKAEALLDKAIEILTSIKLTKDTGDYIKNNKKLHNCLITDPKNISQLRGHGQNVFMLEQKINTIRANLMMTNLNV